MSTHLCIYIILYIYIYIYIYILFIINVFIYVLFMAGVFIFLLFTRIELNELASLCTRPNPKPEKRKTQSFLKTPT